MFVLNSAEPASPPHTAEDNVSPSLLVECKGSVFKFVVGFPGENLVAISLSEIGYDES